MSDVEDALDRAVKAAATGPVQRRGTLHSNVRERGAPEQQAQQGHAAESADKHVKQERTQARGARSTAGRVMQCQTEKARRLAEIDQEYIFLMDRPKAPIMRITEDAGGNRYFTPMTMHQMSIQLENQYVDSGAKDEATGESNKEKLFKPWRFRLDRPQYERMELHPNDGCPPNVYNLWRGWGVEPRPGKFTYIGHLLLHIYCDSDRKLFNYTFKLLAWKFQNLHRLPEVALVLQGVQGAGKSTLCKIVRRLLPHHVVELAREDHLTGKFNAQLHDKLFVLTNEAVYGTDKDRVGALKAMITEPRIQIERKGVDIVETNNMLMLIITSNEDWIVPVEIGDRRLLILRLNDRRAGDTAFWDKFYAALEQELPCFLWALINLPLNGFSPREFPHTPARLEQQLRSLPPVLQWWHECLRAGTFVGAHGKPWVGWSGSMTGAWRVGSWPMSAPTHEFRAAFADWCKGQGHGGKQVDEGTFGKQLLRASRLPGSLPLLRRTR